ncbi:MAG: methyltransferase domain-containing protein, partial [Defluviitaleaceae bacterium]|nr:methyltransferase domain-containing protein [Defluviitaleaceae bacterium]
SRPYDQYHPCANIKGDAEMISISDKNKSSWNGGAARYSALCHSEEAMKRLLGNPANAFHHTTWEMLTKYVPDFPDLSGKKICVPSSGDNMAVFAFAMLGAEVTSCDISENQLANAERVSKAHGWDKSIDFICADTMRLDGIADNAYDFVYTSNGVHVWIDDLRAMYRNIYRIMKPGGVYIMYEIHPFQRPFDDNAKVRKPYDATGPFESGGEVTFGWRVMDIMNAMLDSGLAVRHIEEMFAEKDYDWPFFISLEDKMNGAAASREEVDRMYDWRNNPMAALPNWMCIAAKK